MDSEYHNQNGEWIKDAPRNKFERLYKRYIDDLETHLCDQGKMLFRDLVRLVNAEMERLMKPSANMESRKPP